MKPSGLLLYLFFILSVSISGQILNRSFELAVSTEPNSFPLHWEYENYVRVHYEFIPDTERKKELDWVITEAVDENYFLVLTTGNMGAGSDSIIREAKAWQRVFLPAWTLVKGDYYFGTSDYRPYYDYGVVKLVPFVDPNNPCDPNDPDNPNGCFVLSTIELARCSVDDVGDFSSTGAWVPFSYTILPQQEGIYDIVLSVNDGTDAVYESFFAVDNLSICGPMTPLGDVNRDCSVNIDDLASFSREWLQICNIDPNSIPDPNDPDYISDPNDPNYIDPDNLMDPNCMCADFSRDNIVDVNDLYPIYGNWLMKDI